MSQKPPQKKRICFLSSNATTRDAVKFALQPIGFNADFASGAQDALNLVSELEPMALVHDWDVADHSMNAAFQQRIGKLESFKNIHRFVVTKDITPTMLAIQLDTGIRRIITLARVSTSLGSELQMALQSELAVSELQSKIREIHFFGSKFEQQEIDALVERSFGAFPSDPLVLIEYANLCMRRGDIAQSAAIAEKILEQNPSDVRALNLKARGLMKLGKEDEAIRILESANVLSPKNPDRLVALGKALLKKGATKESGKYFEEALGVAPDHSEARDGSVQVKLTEGDAMGAFELFRNSASEEEAASFFNNAAIQAVRRGQFDEALELYGAAFQSLSSAPLRASVQLNIGLALKKKGDVKGATDAFQRCLKISPDHVRAKALLDECKRTPAAPAAPK